ncbi:IS5/IS1182 family transposase, partial [Francisella tularensis subsp. holarctica]|nr:IS5/IS1182 family transposase [Francisella tularensis subsp. holarctica]
MIYHIIYVFWSIILSFLISLKGIHTIDVAQLCVFIEAVFFVFRRGCEGGL